MDTIHADDSVLVDIEESTPATTNTTASTTNGEEHHDNENDDDDEEEHTISQNRLPQEENSPSSDVIYTGILKPATSDSSDSSSGIVDENNEWGKPGCYLRWSRISKIVEVKEVNAGLVRSSIASKPPTISESTTSGEKNANSAASGSPKMKVILNEVSGSARPGEILALMGPSGSGKTSLLDVLSGRSSFESGTLTINGIEETGAGIKQLKRKIAYIKQSDVFFDHLTVRDQLTYTALLRLPSSWSKVRKHAEVHRIINLLRLNKCADTPIKLVSGGERKRVNIGSELLTDPRVIMLDEPTSGLDSTSAVALLSMLIDLARTEGKTLISSIHQPSSAIFRSFDRLLLLADGCVVYYGSPVASLSYLEQRGYTCSAGYNLADHWMDLLVEDSALEGGTLHAKVGDPKVDAPVASPNNWAENDKSPWTASVDRTNLSHNNTAQDSVVRRGSSFKRIQSLRRRSSTGSTMRLLRVSRAELIAKQTTKARLIECWDNERFAKSIDHENNALRNASPSERRSSIVGTDVKKYNTSWLTQFSVLTHRSMKNSRSAIFTTLNMIESAGLGVMTGLLWFRMPYTEQTVSDRSSWVFFTMTFWVFHAMFGALFSFPNERDVIFKERASGSYRLSAYFVAKTLSEAPTRMALPIIYMIISYWMANVNPKFWIFLASTCCTLLSVMAGESFGLLVGALVMDFEKAMVVMVVFSLTLMVAGGYYVDNIPVFLEWIRYLSPFKYSFDASQQLVFDKNVPCDGSGVLEVVCGDRENGYATPEEVVDFLNVKGSVAFNVCLMFVLFVVPRSLAFWALKNKKGAERS